MKEKNKKLIAISFVLFMVVSGFSVLATWNGFPSIPSSTSGNTVATPQLSNVGETAGISASVNYYVQSPLADIGTTTVTLNSVENTSDSNIAVSSTSTWTLSSNEEFASITVSLGSRQWWGGTKTGSICVQFGNGIDSSGVYAVGTVNASLQINGISYYGYSIASKSGNSSKFYINDTGSEYTSIVPSFLFSGSSGYYSSSITLNVSAPSGLTFSSGTPATLFSSSTTNAPGYFTETSTQKSGDTGFNYGWNYGGLSFSSSFTIYEYLASYDITWSTSQTGEMVYNGVYSTSPGSVTGSLTVNTLSFNSNGADPNVPSYTFSYTMTSTEAVSSANVVDTLSPSYTYSQVSGTTNEASASFTFNFNTPSGAVFVNYETGDNSFAVKATTISFSPTVTVTNPYYTYKQNVLSIQITGASSVSSDTRNTLSPSISTSVSYTSSTNPSWTANLYLYGNIIPEYISHNLVFSGSSSTANMYFNMSQPVFNGEELGISVNWGDGNQNTYTSTTDYNFFEQHTYTSVGVYTVSVYGFNIPTSNSDAVTDLRNSTITYTYTVSVSATTTPLPNSVLQKGEGVTIDFTSVNNLVSGIVVNETYNGVTTEVNNFGFGTPSAGTKVIAYPSYAGSENFVLTATFDGAKAVYSFDFYSPLYPSNTSTYLTTLYSNSATHSYPISLSGVPSGTGYYQQLITIDNPSSYGINTAGSNVQFTASNGTSLYAWIQSINSTSMMVWIKNYNDSSTIDMQVLPSFENLFSATGYLGEAPQLSSVYGASNNMLTVFPIAFAFTNHISNFWDYNSTGQAVNGIEGNDGLKWFANSLTTENVYITTSGRNLANYNFGFTVSSYSNGSILANFWNDGNVYQTGATTVSGIGNYLITDHANGGDPILDNNGVHPTYMTIPDIFFYANISMPTYTIGTFTNMTDHAVASYLSNSITIPMPNWFNLTLKAYTNYSFTFHYNNTPLYFTYDGLINNTIYTGFLDSNLTLDIHFIALGYSGKTELIVGR